MSMPVRPSDRPYVEHVFTASEENCGHCGRSLIVTQTRGRHLERRDGLHILTMRDKRCPRRRCPGRQTIYRPAEELRLALKKDIVGLDVVIEIGERRLRDNLTFAAIHALLRDRVPIAERTVADIFERFLALMSCRAGDNEAVRRELRVQGGMIVLIDGVQFDDHSPVLYVATDVISHTTLFGERHEVRSAEALRGLLERLKAMDVPVLAIVTDKEKGLFPAIRTVFPDVPHQLCQLHFLKRCADPLERPLTVLGAEVACAADKLRKIRREQGRAKPPRSTDEKAEREVADELLLAAHAASKVAGRAPFEPPALKRHERLLRVAEAADVATVRKGGPGRSSPRSRRR